jgi:hypothetical protein
MQNGFLFVNFVLLSEYGCYNFFYNWTTNGKYNGSSAYLRFLKEFLTLSILSD